MDNKEMIVETVNTAATEVAKKTDKTGVIMAGVGFIAGVGLITGLHVIKTKVIKVHAEKKAKATPQVVATENVK